MTVSRATANAIPLTRRTRAARVLACALLSTLAGCAAGNSISSIVPTSSTEPAAAPAAGAPTPAAAPAAPPAAPAAARAAKPPPPPPPAPPPAPEKLTVTEINQACWMDPAINKVPDLDKRLKLVDKCVAEKTKAQGGL
jgi:hypothetical protein